ncbi:MAG TPA: hypothetical protein VM509_03895 [Planctomycetota bacterium]|nr:hypothetical protein [Planctomycetota bacterium]
MSHSAQRKTEIRRSIELLTQVTQHGKLQDHSAMIEAQRQFQVLRDAMSHTEDPALVLLASLGERLTGHMYKGTSCTVDQLREIVTEIAEHISTEITFREQGRGSNNLRKLQLTMSEVRLALRDGQRLGELLVNMTMLTREQVEEAVEVQRRTGQRLGEALLQMRLLTPDMLESALRVQKTKRTKSGKTEDHWSPHRRAE